jgi:hypothetical protein
MDEMAFQAARQALTPSACVFAKAVLAGCGQCVLARRTAMAEREVITCGSEIAHINCNTLNNLFRERALFALRLPRHGEPIAHAKAMKLQCGGLRGLQHALESPVADVHGLVQLAMRDGGSLLDLPWDQIVASISAWELRRRSPPST